MVGHGDGDGDACAYDRKVFTVVDRSILLEAERQPSFRAMAS